MSFLTAESPEFTLEIKRSEFICQIKHVETEDQAKDFIAERKKLHSLATHNCYAYRVNDCGVERSRYSDDGEPQGTAGLPILNVLKNKEFVNVVAVVTRYFGGIKLGGGGLVRAYSEACAGAAAIAAVLECVPCAEFRIEFSYENYKKFSAFRLPKKSVIRSTEYSDKVTVILAVDSSLADSFVTEFEGFYCKRQPISRLSDVLISFDK